MNSSYFVEPWPESLGSPPTNEHEPEMPKIENFTSLGFSDRDVDMRHNTETRLVTEDIEHSRWPEIAEGLREWEWLERF